MENIDVIVDDVDVKLKVFDIILDNLVIKLKYFDLIMNIVDAKLTNFGTARVVEKTISFFD